MPAFANGIDRRLTAEHDGHKGQRLQRADFEVHVKRADTQDTSAESQQARFP